MFWRRFCKTSWRRMAKTKILVLIKTSSEDVWVRRLYSSWSSEDVLKTSSEDERRLQDVFIKTNVCWVLVSIKQNNFTTSFRRRYLTSLWSCHKVAMETSDDVAKTTSLQRLFMTSPNERLQRRRFCNVIRLSHRNYIATSERRCNSVVTTLLCLLGMKKTQLFLNG